MGETSALMEGGAHELPAGTSDPKGRHKKPTVVVVTFAT